MSPSSRRLAPAFTMVGWLVVESRRGTWGSLEWRQIAGGDDGGPRKGQE